MDILGWANDLLVQLSSWMKGYLPQIVLSMVATLLVIYGDNILQVVKQQIGSLKIVLRITLFILFCAFGFGFITSIAAPLFKQLVGSGRCRTSAIFHCVYLLSFRLFSTTKRHDLKLFASITSNKKPELPGLVTRV
ncbi:MAG: DUF3392 family protein [Thiomicrorhabdus sp.]|nr:DUF3392 family protein [Thiomicrorhabdus sp.]